MYRVRQSVFTRALLLPFALLMWLSACHKWVVLEPPYVPSQEAYGKLRVTDKHGAQVVLEEARLEADSVRGTAVTSHMEHGAMRYSKEAVGIAWESVQHIEKRGTNVPATVGLAYLALNVVALVGLLIECSNNPDGMFC